MYFNLLFDNASSRIVELCSVASVKKFSRQFHSTKSCSS